MARRSVVLAAVFSLTAPQGYSEVCNRNIKKCTGDSGISLLQTNHQSVDHRRHVRLSTWSEKDHDRKLHFSLGPQNARQRKIVDMMKHAWKGYKKYCWGGDELAPVTGHCYKKWNLGLTLIDSLDTLYLMGMKDEFKAARDWVADPKALNFSNVQQVSLFETTIRVVGGLLGAHALSGDKVFVKRAHELGDRLLPGFVGLEGKGPPLTDVILSLKKGQSMRDPFIAESTSLGLEFKTLAKLTGFDKYRKAVDDVNEAIHKKKKMDGLAMNQVDSRTGVLFGPYKLGAGGDSYYEYLLKQWLLTGRKESHFLQDYEAAMDGINRHLVNKTRGPLHLTYVGELYPGDGREIDRKMDHLVCFLPGTLALGAHYGADSKKEASWHMDLAKELTRTCYQMYKEHHMLAPEIVRFDTDDTEVLIEYSSAHDLLRPETVESLFYMYRTTGDSKYQDWGWKIANAFEKFARVETGGYASIESVLDHTPEKRNHMESFFPAETLKYLFLLFDDSNTQVPLNEFVFNTEAHPLRIIADDHHTKVKAEEI